MTPDDLFAVCTFLVLPGWALLIFAPGWKWSARLVSSFVLPMILAAVYAVLVAAFLWKSEGGFGSLDEVLKAFENRHILLAGWIHYLTFDLFIGSWEVREAQRLGIPHLWIVPCLALTFLLGPAGLLVFMAVRFGLRRRIWVEEAAPIGE